MGVMSFSGLYKDVLTLYHSLLTHLLLVTSGGCSVVRIDSISLNSLDDVGPVRIELSHFSILEKFMFGAALTWFQ